MQPLALIALADNVREEAAATIRWFRENDVAVKIISGDDPRTVAEVAKRVGVEDADKYISLEGLNDKEVVSDRQQIHRVRARLARAEGDPRPGDAQPSAIRSP